MTRGAKMIIGVLVLMLLGAGAILLTLSFFLLSSRTAVDEPNPLAVSIAEAGKGFLVPPDAQSATNPLTDTPDTINSARRVYTARCALCHGATGKGDTPIGSHTYPRAADLTAARTQSKSDGAIHWIIGNGLPHTGMPGWKPLLNDQTIWELVVFVRQLPKGIPPEPTPTPAPTSASIDASKSVTVNMDNYAYVPAEITVAPGTKVVWTNHDDEDHTVTSVDNHTPLDSPKIVKDKSFEFTFADPGTYKYHCTIHDGMDGVVIVK